MDDQDIFRELSFGIKFDLKRFPEDARKLKFIKTKEDTDSNNAKKKNDSSKLNFFHKEPNNSLKISSENGKHEANGGNSTSEKSAEPQSIQQLRKAHKIFVEGSDVPDLITSFEQLKTNFDLNPNLIKNLKENMKFDVPTPIQMQAITAMLYRREVLACAPTGSGKTLAFLIPLIAHLVGKSMSGEETVSAKRTLKALVVSPTRELAIQTVQVCKQLLAAGSEESDALLLKAQLLDKATMKRFQSAGAKHGNKYDIMVSTPNRLVYLLTHDPPLINLENVEWLVVDESDKLFEEGDSTGFREQLGTIYSSCTSPRIRRAMFSATFAFDVQQWCHLNMDSVIQINVGGKNTAVKSVDQKLLFVGNERGKLIALRELFRQGFKAPVLVFVQSKERAKQLFAELIYDGMNVDAIHADRTPLQRENAVKALRSGTTWILISTELMGRGIDFKGINLVVNYDFPTSAINYIHRIGRTGRAGRRGEAVTFFTEDDRTLLRSIANVIKEAGCPVPDYMLKMKKMAKDEKKKAAKSEVKRETIRTTPKDILEKGKKRKREKNSEGKSQKKKEKKKKGGKEQTTENTDSAVL